MIELVRIEFLGGRPYQVRLRVAQEVDDIIIARSDRQVRSSTVVFPAVLDYSIFDLIYTAASIGKQATVTGLENRLYTTLTQEIINLWWPKGAHDAAREISA